MPKYSLIEKQIDPSSSTMSIPGISESSLLDSPVKIRRSCPETFLSCPNRVCLAIPLAPVTAVYGNRASNESLMIKPHDLAALANPAS
jgi:hypothetical protein